MTVNLASLERSSSSSPAEVEYRWCQFWSKVVTSEVEERPRLVTGGYGRHRSQWVNFLEQIVPSSRHISARMHAHVVDVVTWILSRCLIKC